MLIVILIASYLNIVGGRIQSEKAFTQPVEL